WTIPSYVPGNSLVPAVAPPAVPGSVTSPTLPETPRMATVRSIGRIAPSANAASRRITAAAANIQMRARSPIVEALRDTYVHDGVEPLVLQHEAEQTFPCRLPFAHHDANALLTHSSRQQPTLGVLRGRRAKGPRAGRTTEADGPAYRGRTCAVVGLAPGGVCHNEGSTHRPHREATCRTRWSRNTAHMSHLRATGPQGLPLLPPPPSHAHPSVH